jgi:diguanylate cyclase (GGDEF)-like protein
MAIRTLQEASSTIRLDDSRPVAEAVAGRPRSTVRKLRALLLAGGMFWAARLLALDPAKELTQYRHDVWQDKDGLPQNSIRAMVQTRDGYLWLGTYEGLVRFDGIRFTVFDTQNTPVLKNNTVQALLEGKDGSLWIGTNGGGVTRLKGGVFDRFLLGSGLLDNIVLILFEDHSGRIWVGTESGGLGCFADGSMQVYRKEHGLPGSQITSITEDVGHNLWIGTFGDGLGRWKDASFTSDREDRVPGDRITALLADPKVGKIWVGTWGHGVYALQDARLTQKTTESQSTSIVSTLYEDPEGTLWVGMNAGGPSRLRNGEFSTFSTVEGLSHKTVWAFCQDREGSLWIGTNSGLHRFRDEKFTTYSKKDGLPEEFVRTVYEDRGGNVWIGTIGGLTRLRDGQSTTYTERDGLPNDHILSLHEDRAGSLWIGTRKGLGRLTGGKFGSFQMQDGLSDDNISCIWEDREGALWVGTRAGLNCLRDGRFHVYTMKDGLASDNITALWEARDGALWIGSRGGGLTRLEDKQFTTYDAKTYPFLETIFSFYEDDTGSLWIGTSASGLVRFKEGKFTRYTTENGLFDNTAFQILDDGLGRLWLTSNKGLSAVSKSELARIAERGERRLISAVAYDTSDGMPSRQCNGAGSQPAGWRGRDGRLWIPTARGVAILDPAHIRTNRVVPPVQIESLTVDGRRLRPAGRARLGPGVARIEFEYTALSFVAPERVRFRYWLEGFDKGWVEAGTRRVVSYTTLAPGAYRFRITACNNDGVWNKAGATFEFDVLPRFYQTSWFFGLSAVALLLAGWGAYHARIWRLKQRETELVRLVGVRTDELAEMNKRLEQLSYQDGLTGVANRRLFDDVLKREWRRSARLQVSISLIMIDVDFFKSFNDTHGHLKGDECLKSVASALRNRIRRSGDLVARYGGEEFVIVLPGTDPTGAVTFAEHLRATVEGLGIRHGSSPVAAVVTVSVGVATADLDATEMRMSSEELVNAADRALFRAKEQGRNRVCRFEAEPSRC